MDFKKNETNPTGESLPKACYTIPEFVQVTGLGRSRVYEEIKAGRLRIGKSGRRTLITAAALADFLKSTEV